MFIFLFLHRGISRPLTNSIRAMESILMHCQYLLTTHFPQTLLCRCVVLIRTTRSCRQKTLKFCFKGYWMHAKYRNSNRRNKNVVKQPGYSCWKSVFISRFLTMSNPRIWIWHFYINGKQGGHEGEVNLHVLLLFLVKPELVNAFWESDWFISIGPAGRRSGKGRYLSDGRRGAHANSRHIEYLETMLFKP